MATLDALYDALVNLDESRTLELAKNALATGDTTPLMMLNTCQQALKMVGERYERGEYYLTALVMAGELFKEVLELTPPLPAPMTPEKPSGRIVLGTVRGDIHDIGKNLFATAMQSQGFEVIDLGVDVPRERFFEEVRKHHPDVVCLSGLILAAFESMKATTRLLRSGEKEIGYKPPIVIGGGTVDADICRFVGADSWSTDAMEGVRMCQKLVNRGGY